MHPQPPFRRLPVGAEVSPEGGVHFRVWAPQRKKMVIILQLPGGAFKSVPMLPEPEGYFSVFIEEASEGTLYRFEMDEEGNLFPDPASRFQPEGPEGPSQVVDPDKFIWNDHGWGGISIEGQVIYELHIGTFTLEGTYRAALPHLTKLIETGITLLQIMPVADFVGQFGWGYDGVHLYAPTRLYGTPNDFRLLVDHAHSLGIGVILDVVYNHLGPAGNVLKEYSDYYFSRKHVTEWGQAFNFDGEYSKAVREFIIFNAGYWIKEFHIDGLRIDASQSIFDDSKPHILSAITKHARKSAEKKSIVIIAENEPQETKLIRSEPEGGFGMDGLLNDDFHHSSMVALTGRSEAYYSDYSGTPQEFISCAKWGYLYQGQYNKWQQKRRGTPTFGIKPAAFVNFLQNHDQVANTLKGQRFNIQTSPGKFRTMTALLLLMPSTPLLFMGQEFCSSSPFVYFADHDAELAKKVREGRLNFMRQFPSLRDPNIVGNFLDPADRETFLLCKLDHEERVRNQEAYLLHRDLLKLRREDPVFRAQRADWLEGAILSSEAFLLRLFGETQGDRLLLINLGKDLDLIPAPVPLLAPRLDGDWEILWSSESVIYGGTGTPPVNLNGQWHIPSQSAIVLTTKPL